MKIIRRKFCIFFLCSIHISIYGQQINWQRCYGGSQNDFLEKVIRTNSLEQLIVAGNSNSFDGDLQGSFFGDHDWVWYKIDTLTGSIVLRSTAGGSNADFLADIIPAFNGGYLAVGTTFSNDLNVSGNHGAADIWVVKFSETGTIDWQKCFGGSLDDQNPRVIKTNDTSYAILGWTSSVDGDISSNHGSPGTNDFWLFKIDTSGALIFSKTFGGTADEFPKQLLQTSDGDFLLIGNTWSNDSQIIGNHGQSDVLLIQTDSDGNFNWAKCFGGSGMESANSLVSIEEHFFIIGTNNSNDGDVSFNHLNFNGNPTFDAWVLCIDSLGLIQWEKSYGGDGVETGECIFAFDGYMYFGAVAGSNNGDVTQNHASSEYWIVRIDTLSNLIWQNTYGGQFEDYITSLLIDSLNIYAVGHTMSTNGDITFTHGSLDGWVLKINNNGIILGSTLPLSKIFNVFPNPVSAGQIINVIGENDCYSSLIDALGNVIYFGSVKAGKNYISLPSLSSGIYFLKLSSSNINMCYKIYITN
jgi:hypothetical protein